MTFGENLKRMREYRHFSIQQLAIAAGVYYNKIYRVEKGPHTMMTIVDAIKVARALGTTVEALFGEERTHLLGADDEPS